MKLVCHQLELQKSLVYRARVYWLQARLSGALNQTTFVQQMQQTAIVLAQLANDHYLLARLKPTISTE